MDTQRWSFLMDFCFVTWKGFSNDKLFGKLLQFQLILGHLVVVIQTCFRLISFRQTVTWMVTIIAPTIVQPVLFQCNLIKLICQNIQTLYNEQNIIKTIGLFPGLILPACQIRLKCLTIWCKQVTESLAKISFCLF